MEQSSTTVEKDSTAYSEVLDLIETALKHAAAGIERASDTAAEAAEAARTAAEAAEAAGVEDWSLELSEAAEHLQDAADLSMALALELELFDPAQCAALAAIAAELATLGHGTNRHEKKVEGPNDPSNQLSIEQAAEHSALSNRAHVRDLPAHQPTRAKRPQRLPPYARRIVDARRRCERIDRIIIAAGAHAWKIAAGAAEPIVILPEGEDPGAFRWFFVTGLPCRIVPTAPGSVERMEHLAAALVQAGSPRVELPTPAGDDMDVYLPRLAPAATTL